MAQQRSSPKEESSAGTAVPRAIPGVRRATAPRRGLLERTREMLGSVGRQMAARRGNLDRLDRKR